MSISFTQGDTAIINLTAQDGSGNPFNITGATLVSQILGPLGVIATFPNSQHTIIDPTEGQYTLTLSTSDTAECLIGNNKTILTQITQGASVIMFRGVAILNVNPAVPLQ